MSRFLNNLFKRLTTIKNKPRRLCAPPQLTYLEDRITPATVSVVGTDVIITLATAENITNLNTSTTGAVITVNTVGSDNNTTSGIIPISVSVTNNTVVIDTAAFTTFTGIKVVGGTGNNTVTVGASGIDLTAVSTNSVNQSVSIDLLTTGGADTLNVNGAIKTKGDGQVSLASRSISITADITTATGDIVLNADNGQQTGNFVGVFINGTGVDVTTGGGNITIVGRGGDTGGNNYGVFVLNGAKVQAGNNGSSTFGTVSVTGTGGATSGNFNIGVFVDGTGSIITSSGGSVTVIGNGGGTGSTSVDNYGVIVLNAGLISAGGTGTVSVTGTGGATGGVNNYGVFVIFAGSKITSSGGSVTVIGNGGGTGSTSVDNYGVNVFAAGLISAGGTSTVSVTGTGGVGASSTGIELSTGTITTNSSAAAITLTADSMDFGFTSVVSSTGTVTLRNKTAGVAIDLGTETTGQLSLRDAELDFVTAGTLVIGRSDVNPGVITVSNALTLPSTVSALQLIGPAGITLNNNVTTPGSQTYTGAVTLTGNVLLDTTNAGGSTAGANITFGAGISGAFNLGLNAGTGGAITGTSVNINNLTITNSGGTTFQSTVDAATATITNTTGTVAFQGNLTIGNALVTAAQAYNVSITGTSNIIAGLTSFLNTGTVTLGNGTNDSTTFANGLVITDPSSIAIQGTVATTNTTMTLGDATTPITNNGTLNNPAVLNAGTGIINLAGNVTGNASLNPLKVITSGAGLTTVSGVNTAEVQFTSGVVTIANPSDQTGGYRVLGGTLQGGSMAKVGYIYAQTGTSTLAPGISGPGMMHTNELFLSSGNTVQIDLQGTTPVTGYDQFVVCNSGNVNLASATLNLTSTITPASGTVFTIIDNQDSRAILGTFAGLAQGATVTANGRSYQISYTGGTGSNDVTLTVVAAPTVTNISPAAGPIAGGTSITITGTDFTGATAVTIGGTAAATFAFVNSTTITATTPAHAAGTASVVVTTLGGTNSANTLFTYAAAPSPSPSPTPTPTPPTPTPTPPTPTPTAPLVVGTPPPTSSGGSSTVTLYDPVTGAEAGTAVPFPGFNGPVKVASGDFNSDGVAELVAGAGFGGGPAIAILNSQTGEVMQSFFAFDPAFTGGVFVAVQDTNGDGILDIIASAGPGGGPEVRIFNGANLNLLRSFFAYAEDFRGGVSVASIDFNNDGILDLVTGAGPGGAPHVKVYDGATNSIISQWYAYPVTFTGGVFVAVGDIGNDGTFEVVTGAGAGGAPVVAVWDPFTGALLAQFMAYAEEFTGGVRVGVNDGNGDGVPDILTGAGPGGGPHVKAFSFPALDLLFEFYSGEQTNTGGVFVS